MTYAVAVVTCLKLSLVSCRYGNVVEDYLDVYLRTPDLPKDDITRALVARGRARKGAGQKLLLMASRGQCHLPPPLYGLKGRILLTAPSLPSNFAYDISQTSRRPRPSTHQTENSSSTGAASPPFVLPSLTCDLTFHVPLSFVRSTFQAFPHPNAFRRKFGTKSQALFHGTSSARGSPYPPSIATSPSVASSAPSTYTSVKIRTAGSGRSTSSTGSRWTRSSRVESRFSEFIGHMTIVTCSKS